MKVTLRECIEDNPDFPILVQMYDAQEFFLEPNEAMQLSKELANAVEQYDAIQGEKK